MNIKNQKLVSRIICGALIPFLLLLNAGAAQVAYAEDPQPPATPGLKCPDPFTPTPDNQYCKMTGAKAKDTKCPDSFHISKTMSTVDPTGKYTDELWCAPDVTANLSAADTKAISNGIQILGGVQKALNRLIWPVLVLIGGLMENDLLYGNGMEEKLQDIWIPIRNLVNILFVIVLVGLALYNVLGLSDDNTSIKSMLPKIVIGIIAVNFSFVAIKVVLDGINVMTTSIFALPDQVGTGLSDTLIGLSDDQQTRLCAALEGTSFSQFDSQSDETIKQLKDQQIYVQAGQKYSEASIATTDTIDQVKQKVNAYAQTQSSPQIVLNEFNGRVLAAQNADLCTGKTLSDQGKVFLTHYNSRNAAFALALNMGKIVFYNDVDPKIAGSAANGYEKLFTNTLFSMVLYLIYAVSFIALFIVLLGRLVVMWLSIAVSPILLLMLASSQVKEKLGGLGKLAEQFTKNAIAPLLISLSLTVGWIMLKAVQGLNIGSEAGSFIGNSVFKINPTNGVPVASLNTLQDFMVALGVIAVVWLGVFSAAEGTIAESATNWIKERMKTAGKFIGTLPVKHMPLLPIALPEHPHDHYTFSQLGHYIESLSRGNESKLEEFAKGTKSATTENLRDMHDESGIVNWLKNYKEGNKDLTSEESRAGIKSWLADDRNRGTIQAMRDAGGDKRKLIDNMEKLASKDEKLWKDAAKEINKNPIILKSKGELPTSTTPKPPTPPKPGDKKAAAPSGVTKESDLGKKLAKDGESEVQSTTRIGTVNTSKSTIDAELKKEAKKQKADTIKTQVRAIGKAFGETGKMKTDEEKLAAIKSLLGDNYEGAKKACGGNDIDVVTTMNGPATPPTPPTSPTSPTPPASPIR